jgi:uncharacterized protein YqeY
MKLKEKIQNELTLLAKEQNNVKKELLKVVLSEISREKTKDVSDDVVLRIIRKMKENATECNNTEEAKILDEYLPKMMKESELKTIISNHIEENNYSGIKDLGRVMLFLNNSEYSSRIDNKIAVNLVRELL